MNRWPSPSEHRLIAAHLRSESGPTLTRFALDFAQHSGGDLLWLAYVPDGVRGWFLRFADSRDPSLRPGSPLRIARLFSSPTIDEIAFLLTRIERQGTPRVAEAVEPAGEAGSSELSEIAEEIDRGGLHLTAIVVDIHHLPIFSRRLRDGGVGLPHDDDTSANSANTRDAAILHLHTLLRKLTRAKLHVLVATPIAAPVKRGVGPTAGAGEAAVLDAIDAAVDLTIVVSADGPPREKPDRFRLSVQRSRYPQLPAPTELPGATWKDVLETVRPRQSWPERLARACPRLEARGLGVIRESAPTWTDANQEEFARWAERRGWTVTRASSEQDRAEHWDLCLERGGVRYRVDVKAQSKARRSDPEPQDIWHWIELRGIADDGWLFGGKAELIAFQTSDSFVLVRRVDLAAHVCHHVDPEDTVKDPRRAEYRVYHRRDTVTRARARATGADRGVLTLVPTSRLRRLAWEEWSE